MIPTRPVRVGYQPEIDGLRAVAVAGVIAYHAAPTGLPGGFVGVDVFFVISGFLITRLILDRHATDGFSFLAFYSARVRRIVPALAVVLALTACAALFWFPPADLARFGRSLMWSSGFASNYLFVWQGGYFDPSAADDLLLHTWSLAVEEQFYLLAPLGLFIVARSRLRRFTPALLALAALASLLIAEWYLRTGAPNAAFYLPQARMWEFLVGGAVAAARVPAPTRKWAAEGLTGVGLGMIALAMGISASIPFPGVGALLPCLGAVLVLVGAGGSQVFGGVLRSAPLVSIGLISYSLYLWHWPLLALPRVLLMRPLSPVEILAALVACVVLATLTWWGVERPFRRVRPPEGMVRALAGGAVVMAMLFAAGLILVRWEGFPARASANVLAAEAAFERPASLGVGCHLQVGARPGRPCTSRPGAPDILLWGDSHAMQLIGPVRAGAEREGLILRQSTKSGCLPLVGASQSPECEAFNMAVIGEMEQGIEHVVLAGRWVRGPDVSSGLSREMTATLARIRAVAGPRARIVIVGQEPSFAFAPSLCHARYAFRGAETWRCDALAPLWPEATARADQALAAAAGREPNVALVRPGDILCPSGACPARSGAVFYFRDDNHLTSAGAARLAPALERALALGN